MVLSATVAALEMFRLSALGSPLLLKRLIDCLTLCKFK